MRFRLQPEEIPSRNGSVHLRVRAVGADGRSVDSFRVVVDDANDRRKAVNRLIDLEKSQGLTEGKALEAAAEQYNAKLLEAMDSVITHRESVGGNGGFGGAGEDESPSREYQETSGGLVWIRQTQDGPSRLPLANFNARITAQLTLDDGAEREQTFEIEADRVGHVERFSVPAARFAAMNWPIEHLGAKAIVHPGQGTKDRLRHAIQSLSGDVDTRTIYTHTGWRHVGGEWVFLHAAGAIGKDGPVEGIEVRLPEPLAGYVLPPAPADEEAVRCVRASLAVLGMAPDRVTFPALCAAYRAPLGPCDLSVHLVGGTQVFKTEAAALVQQHYGPAMDSRHLPGSWESTDNALEAMAFAAKDVVFTIDDFAPRGTAQDIQRLHGKADRVLRAQGNRSARQRCRTDGTPRPSKPPRGLIQSTGEDTPRGQSLRARMLIDEVGPGDIDAAKLTLCQRDAAGGTYAAAMAAYVHWLSPRMDHVFASLRDEVRQLRDQADGGPGHRRTPDVVANLAVGLKYLLAFARELGAVNEAQARALWERGWNALTEVADGQAAHQIASEPTARFLDLLRAAIASGSAHLSDSDGNPPANPAGWGYERRTVGTGENMRDDWHARGKRVGWVEGDDIYLDSATSYAVAQQMSPNGDGLVITEVVLRKRLDDKGLLIRDQKRQELTVRRILCGVQQKVLYLRPGVLHPVEPAKTAIPATDPTGGSENGLSYDEPMAGDADCGQTTRQNGRVRSGLPDVASGHDAGNGGFGGWEKHKRAGAATAGAGRVRGEL